MRKCLIVLCLLVGGCDTYQMRDAKAAALCERQGTRLYMAEYTKYPYTMRIICTNGLLLEVSRDELRAVVGPDVEKFLLNDNRSHSDGGEGGSKLEK